ncbi:hypothetical protein BaRGS_00027342 [Batillaria attramentaria]|uniref:Uncharacterized protein n=1 Tax=Batillaria attramentaria TaxID=370345 RepID=A0ABD0K251_9CAEN
MEDKDTGFPFLMIRAVHQLSHASPVRTGYLLDCDSLQVWKLLAVTVRKCQVEIHSSETQSCKMSDALSDRSRQRTDFTEKACSLQMCDRPVSNMSSSRGLFSSFGRAMRTGAAFVVVLLFFFASVPSCSGINAKIPLISEDLPTIHKNEPEVSKRKSIDYNQLYRILPAGVGTRGVGGCHLDGEYYRFEEKWSPILIPHGKMHCVKCECLAVSTRLSEEPAFLLSAPEKDDNI